MNYQEKISTIVEEALTEKTFSLEIITKIKALKDVFESVTNQNVELEKQVTFFQGANATLSTENTKVIAQNEAYKSREVELAKKEKEADKKEYELAFQTKRGNEIKELFGIVFKNPTTQSMILRNTSGQDLNGNYRSGNENETVTKTVL